MTARLNIGCLLQAPASPQISDQRNSDGTENDRARRRDGGSPSTGNDRARRAAGRIALPIDHNETHSVMPTSEVARGSLPQNGRCRSRFKQGRVARCAADFSDLQNHAFRGAGTVIEQPRTRALNRLAERENEITVVTDSIVVQKGLIVHSTIHRTVGGAAPTAAEELRVPDSPPRPPSVVSILKPG